MTSSREISNYHDFLAYALVYAPDGFPVEDYLRPEAQMTLDAAFDQLRRDLPKLRSRVKLERQILILDELLKMSYEAYAAANDVRGAHILQEFEGVVWPKNRVASDFVREAEQRLGGAFAAKA